MAMKDRPVGRAIHFCEECEAAILERPLEDVIEDIAGGDILDLL
jgi:hypothetical protein